MNKNIEKNALPPPYPPLPARMFLRKFLISPGRLGIFSCNFDNVNKISVETF